MEKYSVLMSVYAKENPAYLRESIESMLCQTLPADQFVLVKDGPLPKELNDIIDVYCQMHTGLFSIVSLDTNRGLGFALDSGLEHCRNDLVARMDSDDLSLPMRCEKQVLAYKEHEGLCLLGANVDEFFDDHTCVVQSRVVPSKYDDIKRLARRRNPFNHPSVMYRKAAVLRCGGYGNVRYRQDYDLFSRMLNQGCYALNINESLVLFRSNTDAHRRRKNWMHCKGTMAVAYGNWKRGYCSLIDLLYVVCGQTALFCLPLQTIKWITDTFFRRKVK